MPSYAKPFGLAGGLAGGAAGAGAGGLLGQLLGSLNMPRNALWALPGRLSQGDYLGALPGLAGLAAGGIAAMTPAAPFAGLIGSAVGGLGEGAEEAMRPDMQAAPEASDLVRALGGDPESFGGQALGMGLGMAGDPLSYAGGLGGEAVGKDLGESGGRYLEGAAAARGPRYPGGEEKLTGLLDQLGGMDPSQAHQFRLNVPKLLQSPQVSRLLHEIEPGSSPVAAGMEGIVLKRPSGGVTRIAGAPGQMRIASPDPMDTQGLGIDWNSQPPPPRPDDPAMLQNVRDVTMGPLRTEHVPEAQFGKFDAIGRPQDDLAREVMQARRPLTADVQSRGRQAVDMHGANIGRTSAGKIAITDPSNVLLPDGETTPEKIGQGPPQGWLTNKLLDLLGADQGVRNDINMGIKQPPTAGITPAEAAAFHQQQNALFAAAQANPGAPMPPLIGANAGLPTGQDEQASELMKALGLSPGGASDGGPLSSFGSGSLEIGWPPTDQMPYGEAAATDHISDVIRSLGLPHVAGPESVGNFPQMQGRDQQALLRQLVGNHDDLLFGANKHAVEGNPDIAEQLMAQRNAIPEQLRGLVGTGPAQEMLDQGMRPPAATTAHAGLRRHFPFPLM